MQIIKPDVNINFVGCRQIAYGLSLIMILASIISLVTHGGPKLGIDFAGGAEMLVRFDNPVPIKDVKSALQSEGLGGAAVQQYGDNGGNVYRILIPSDVAETQGLNQQISKTLSKETQLKVTMRCFLSRSTFPAALNSNG
jgi:preprotein translocase subunit SecF